MQAVQKPQSFEKQRLRQSGNHEANRVQNSANFAGSVNGNPLLPFDVRQLMARVDGNREILPNLVRSLKTQWRELTNKMQSAIKRRDSHSVISAAQRLALSFQSLGHRTATRFAEELKAAAELSRWKEAEQTLKSLKQSTDQLLLALETYAKAAVSAD
jgi:HPt (histidine-containing phosphotransfer) domain-containing protein